MVRKLFFAIALVVIASVLGGSNGLSSAGSLITETPTSVELRARSLVGLTSWLAAQTQDVVPPPAPDGPTVVCPECKGTGKASHLGETFDCPVCGGRGRVLK